MLWLGVLIGTIGIVMIVPTVLRAIDGKPLDSVNGSISFGATGFGVVGVIASQIDARFVMQFIVALAVGGALAAFHREILMAFRGDQPEVDPHASVVLEGAVPESVTPRSAASAGVAVASVAAASVASDNAASDVEDPSAEPRATDSANEIITDISADPPGLAAPN